MWRNLRLVLWINDWHCACWRGWHILVLASLGIAFLYFAGARLQDTWLLQTELDATEVHHVLMHEKTYSKFGKDIRGEPK